MSPGREMSKLLVQVDSRYVVVPDFFADDMVFSADSSEGATVGLPSENFVLHMVDGGDAIIMCVWQSNAQSAEIVFSGQGTKRIIRGSQIQCIKESRMWVGFMESANIWHERTISDKEKNKEIVLDWRPPFPATWRADFVREYELSESWNFRTEQEEQSDNSALSYGMPKRYPCWFDGGQACMLIPQYRPTEKTEHDDIRYSGPVIVYPIDRSRATPLTVFCPIDIMRNTLGVGPCQYVLEKEGFGSQLHPTAADVTSWVEKQFRKKKEKRTSEEIKERFKQMVVYIGQVQSRIKRYGDFARQVRKLISAGNQGIPFRTPLKKCTASLTIWNKVQVKGQWR